MEKLSCFLLLTLLVATCSANVEGGYHCAMRGVDESISSRPVVYNGTALSPPYPLITDCYEFVDRACCNAYNTESMTTNFQTASMLFFKCPACLTNLKRMWCHYTCDPEQSRFIEVTKSKKVFGMDLMEVRETLFRIHPHVANALFDSCKDVTLPDGSKGSASFGATPWEFLNTMGGKKYSPYPMIFNITTENSLDIPDMPSCAESCGCQDCSEVCGTAPEPEVEHECKIGSISCMFFSTLIATAVFVAAVLFIAPSIYKKTLGTAAEYQPILSSAPAVEPETGKGLAVETQARLGWNVLLMNNIRSGFYKLGLCVAHHPWRTIFISLFFVVMISHGILMMKIQSDPNRIWVPPGSRSQKEESRFIESFGRFWRIEQLIFTANENRKDKSLINQIDMQEMYNVQHTIMNMSVDYHFREWKLTDLCFKPMAGKGCNIESPMQYFQDKRELIFDVEPEAIERHIDYCTNTASLDPECVSELGIPVFPNVIFGGYGGREAKRYNESTAMMITIMLNTGDEVLEPAQEWEKVLLDFLNSYKNPRMDLAYMTERSVQDEVSREGNANVPTVVISYIIMFLYVGFAFGRWPKDKSKGWQYVVLSKFGLSMCGIMVVVSAVAVTCGIMSVAKVETTLIIFEVIPFLVLAIGVDNLFIIINRFERFSTSEDVDLRLAKTLAHVGPSITLAALCEAFAFGLGYLTKMPAIQSFALYASCAILVDFILQITAFAACLVLDSRRVEHNEMDVCTCVQCHVSEGQVEPDERMLRKIMRGWYGPCILHPISKIVIILVFGCVTLMCVNWTSQVSVGLNQSVALPQDSYLQQYFNQQEKYLEQGPPVFFVVEGLNVTDHENQNKICGMGAPCHNTSLVNYVSWLSLNPDVTCIAVPTNSWLDDYMSWLWSSQCCMWPPGCEMWVDCEECIVDGKGNSNVQPFMQWRPPADKFTKFVDHFLDSTCIDTDNMDAGGCGVCGTPYVGGVDVARDGKNIKASRFMTYHTPLNSQDQFIKALEQSYKHVDAIKKNEGIDVYSYSIFYVFFEQYLYIFSTTMLTLSLALVAVLVVTGVLLGDVVGCLVILLMVLLIQFDMIGFMYLWDIQLNAISVTNLVVCMGISIEFCVHIAHSFLHSQGSRQERALFALIDVGSSVVGGITLTKFCGVVVLAFAQSAVFTIYYFRMYLLIVLLGAAHGLCLLPVVLSLIGPDSRATNSGSVLSPSEPDAHHGRGIVSGSVGAGSVNTDARRL